MPSWGQFRNIRCLFNHGQKKQLPTEDHPGIYSGTKLCKENPGWKLMVHTGVYPGTPWRQLMIFFEDLPRAIWLPPVKWNTGDYTSPGWYDVFIIECDNDFYMDIHDCIYPEPEIKMLELKKGINCTLHQKRETKPNEAK